MESDYQKTGKLYPKLNAYLVKQRKESFGVEIYMGSSCQFRTQKAYKNWLLSKPEYSHLTIKITKGEP